MSDPKKGDYAFVTYGTKCAKCDEHVQGVTLAQYDGQVKKGNTIIKLFRFLSPAKCANGHEMKHYIHETKA